MARLIVFTRLTCPSTLPELHSWVRPALTASKSWRRNAANLATGGTSDCSAWRIQACRGRPGSARRGGLRPEAETALRDVLSLYEGGDEDLRIALRTLLERCHSFCGVTTLPFEPTSQGFRQRLLKISVEDQGRDARDMMVHLNDLCGQTRDAGVDIRPLLLDVAELSTDVDKYGMGSTRDILLRAAGREPSGLW